MESNDNRADELCVEQCKKRLFADERIKYFFEVSIPYAKKKGEALGHVLFICPDEETKCDFTKILTNSSFFEAVRATNLLSTMAPGDLAAVLTALQPGEVLISNTDKLVFEDTALKVMKDALSEFFMDIIIGKGPGARSCRIDLPPFTFVCCVSATSKTVAELSPFFDHIIKVDDVNLPKICITAIKEHSTFPLSDELCDMIAHRSRYDVQASIKCLNRIIEYAEYKNQQELTKELIEDAIELSGIGVALDDYVEDDDETLRLFREMNDSLRSLKDDVNFIRNNIEDFLAANGML